MKVTDEQIQSALKVLDKATDGDASEWFTYRQKTGQTRIVDPATGKWVSQFKGASGTVYYIRSPHQGIGMRRYTEMMKRLPAIGFDDTFEEMKKHVERAIAAANSIGGKEPKLSDLFTNLTNLHEGIRRNDRKWQMSYILATLFVVTKDEDTSTWSFEQAHEKIEDWSDSDIHEYDFFFLVQCWQFLHAKWYALQPGKIKQVVNQWSPLS